MKSSIQFNFFIYQMSVKPINFRTKTHHKTQSLSLSQQFTQIQKVLTQYEKKKFHPKIENFKYMSTNSIMNPKNKRRYLLKKDTLTLSSQKIFGPLPQVFTQSEVKKKTERSYDISQITFASSEQKEAYTKMSKLRNPQKRRKPNQVFAKSSQRYIQTMNKNFMQMLGKQANYNNWSSSKGMFEDDERQFIQFQKQRNMIGTRSDLKRQLMCKKYAQIQLEQFLQQDTKLTKSQKRRITQYKKRDYGKKQQQQQQSYSGQFKKREDGTKRSYILIKQQGECVNNKEREWRDSGKNLLQRKGDDEDGIHFSNKGWLVIQNNESNLLTL